MLGKKVSINISGELYETLERTLSRYPETLLGNESKRNKYFCERSNQLFFNRSRGSFGAILYFYQSYGKLSCPPNLSLEVFEEECRFFEISECLINSMKEREGILLSKEEPPPKAHLSVCEKIWKVVDNPESSVFAVVFALFSFFMITLSIASTCLDTVSSLHGEPNSSKRAAWDLTELLLSCWFLFELVMRAVSSPSKIVFIQQTLNIIDVLAIAPYFVTLCFSDDLTSFGFLRILRFARVVRLFRLSKHSRRLKVAGAIIKSSLGDLRLLFICLIILNIFGGSLMFYIEGYNPDTQFHSIPDALWWAIQTVVTLGYGDIVPITVPGKLFAASYMAFGALTISLPVLSIVTKFTYMYERNL